MLAQVFCENRVLSQPKVPWGPLAARFWQIAATHGQMVSIVVVLVVTAAAKSLEV